MSSDGPAKPLKGLRDLDAIDAVFGALDHPARRHILQVLVAHGGTATAGELSSRFAHSWPTTSRHLGILLDAGVVSVAAVGRQRHYQVERQQLGDVLALWLRSIGFELWPTVSVEEPARTTSGMLASTANTEEPSVALEAET